MYSNHFLLRRNSNGCGYSEILLPLYSRHFLSFFLDTNEDIESVQSNSQSSYQRQSKSTRSKRYDDDDDFDPVDDYKHRPSKRRKQSNNIDSIFSSPISQGQTRRTRSSTRKNKMNSHIGGETIDLCDDDDSKDSEFEDIPDSDVSCFIMNIIILWSLVTFNSLLTFCRSKHILNQGWTQKKMEIEKLAVEAFK